MKSESISIIGCGWLGLALAKELRQSYHIKGSTTRAEKLLHLKELGIEAYIYNASEAQEASIVGLFDAEQLIITIPPLSRQEHMLASYPDRVTQIIEQARENKVRRIIFTSSTGIYPDTNKVVTESTPITPTTLKQEKLLAAEEQIKSAEIPYIILRLAGLYGDGREPGTWFSGKTNLSGGLTPINMIHQTDVVNVIKYLLARHFIKNEIFNICHPDHPTKKEFYTYHAIKKGFEPPLWRETQDPFKIVSSDKIQDLIRGNVHFGKSF